MGAISSKVKLSEKEIQTSLLRKYPQVSLSKYTAFQQILPIFAIYHPNFCDHIPNPPTKQGARRINLRSILGVVKLTACRLSLREIFRSRQKMILDSN